MLDQRPKLVVGAQAAPDLVPERSLLAECHIRLEADEEDPLDLFRTCREIGKLAADRGVPASLRKREGIAEQVLAGREVVVHERLGHARFEGDACHPQPVGALAENHATCCLEDVGGAIRRCARGGGCCHRCVS